MQRIAMTKDELLGLTPKPESVKLPNGKSVYVREMTLAERDGFEGVVYADGEVSRSKFSSELLARCLCDEAGTRLFADNESASVGSIGSAVLDPANVAARRLNRMRAVDVEEASGN